MDKKAYSGKVIRRFLQGKDLQEFVKSYEANISHGRNTKVATKQDFDILEAYLKGTPARDLMKKYGGSAGKIYTSIRVAAVSKLG